MSEHLPSSDDIDGHSDYFVDMIEQLAERAREIGEVEVALHLEATAKARREKLDHDARTGPRPSVRS